MGFLSSVWAKLTGALLLISGFLFAMLRREKSKRKEAERKARLYVVKDEITEYMKEVERSAEAVEDEEINRRAKEARDNWRDHIND